MDKNYLEILLNGLRPTSDSIKKTAEYCSAYPGVAPEITNMIEEMFSQARKDRKKIFLFLIHEIILEEKNKIKSSTAEHPYIRAFGNKLKTLFSDFVACNDDFSDLEKVQTIVKRWEKEQIYHPSFLDKLKLIIKPKFEQLRQQNQTFNQLNQKDASFQKILQLNIKVVQENPLTGKAYNYLLEQNRIDEELLKLSSEHDKVVEFEEEQLNAWIERADQLHKKTIDIIKKNQELQMQLCHSIEPLFEEYENFNLDDVAQCKESLKI